MTGQSRRIEGTHAGPYEQVDGYFRAEQRRKHADLRHSEARAPREHYGTQPRSSQS